MVTSLREEFKGEQEQRTEELQREQEQRTEELKQEQEQHKTITSHLEGLIKSLQEDYDKLGQMTGEISSQTERTD